MIQFDFTTELAPPVKQTAKILKALIERPYISEAENFAFMNGFRMRLSELRELLAEKQVSIHKVKHEFKGEFEDGWCYRYFILGCDQEKCKELYEYINSK